MNENKMKKILYRDMIIFADSLEGLKQFTNKINVLCTVQPRHQPSNINLQSTNNRQNE